MPPGRGVHPQPPPDSVFADMLRAARELLAIRSPLDAELLVSEMLGTWWGVRLPNADVEEVVGEALVDYTAKVRTPAALALLTGIARLGTTRQASAAESAALALAEEGVRRASWAERITRLRPRDCYVSRSVFADTDEVICVFSYGDTDPHALVCAVDYNAGGLIRDAWVTTKVDRLLEHGRNAAVNDPLATFDRLEPARARTLLEPALAETDDAERPPVGRSFGSYHALVRARVRALPPGPEAGHPRYSRDRRAMMAAQFLASDEAADLSDSYAASGCVDRIIDYGCDRDFGRPLRVSPVKVEVFLLDWLPRKVMLSPGEQEAMPHVLAAWIRWAGRRTGLPAEAVRATLDALWELTERFAEAYRDPAAIGLDRAVLGRLLPDGDLEALPRRMFAFPVLTGVHGDVDLSTLDPADPADRAELIRLDHADPGPFPAEEPEGRHRARHEELARRLWDGRPAQLWTAAQRLLDLGHERHDVLHILMEVLRESGDDEDALANGLEDL
ncbi:MAG: hypothetical protein GEV11_03235 [Streptosporangiales bacterium]|nr:hypothetical protein [Streptosporangiales bacterium]